MVPHENVLEMPTAGMQPFASESRGRHLHLGEAKLAPGTAQAEPVLEQGHPAFPAPAGLPGSRQDSPGQLL